MQAILVVGAGPVGLTMAAELARYRIPVRIIDRAPEPTRTSKALAIWSRTLELRPRSMRQFRGRGRGIGSVRGGMGR